MRFSGFTLIEALVAAGIAGILGAAVMSSSMSMYTTMKESEQVIELERDLTLVGEWMSAELQGVGGGSVRPWVSVQVANDCVAAFGMPACNGSDRLTMFVTDASFPMTCRTSGRTGNNINVQNQNGSCCLDQAAWENRSAAVIRADGSIADFVFLFNQTGGCKINTPPGQGPSALSMTNAELNNGTLVAGSIQTFYLDTATSTMKRWVDVNGNNTIDGTEAIVIADRVVDLQFALGYDNNGDGTVVDARTTTDEWLHNVAGDPATVAGMAGGTTSALRMIRSSYTMAATRSSTGTRVAQTLDGPTLTSPTLQYRTMTSTVFFRNIAIFF